MIDDASWLGEVPSRPFVERDLEVRFPMQPGDRPLVEPGERVAPGAPLLERLRDRRVEEVTVPRADGVDPVTAAEPAPAAEAGADDEPGTTAEAEGAPDRDPTGEAGASTVTAGASTAQAGTVAVTTGASTAQAGAAAGDGLPSGRGAPWRPAAGRRFTTAVTSRLGRRGPAIEGELMAPIPGRRDRWRLVTGDQRDLVESPVSGDVVAVRPGSEIVVRVTGLGIRGAIAAGSPAHGRLELATDPFGDLRAGGIDVGRAGSILVAGARIDAEALTRARAMGVRGIVVASLSGKDLHDFQASERRQRASLHAAPPFGVVALEGMLRRRIPGPLADLLTRLAGREVGLVIDPPGLVFDDGATELPALDPTWVRVRSGPSAGAEGRLIGPAGLRWFAGGVQLEAALVALGDEPPQAVALGDLERLV